MQQNNKTKAIVEGALIAAITAILALASYYIPVLSLLMFILPTPIIVLGKRNGFSISLFSTIVAGIIITMFSSPISGLSLYIYFAFGGVAIGYAYYKKLSNFNKFIYGYGAFLASMIIGITLFEFVTSISLIENFINTLEISGKQILDFYSSSGMVNQTAIENLDKQVEMMVQTIKIIFPSMMLLVPLFLTFINIAFSNVIIRKLGYDVIKISPISQWKLPKHTKYGVFIIFVIISIGKYIGIPNFDIIYSNLIYLIFITFFIVGLGYVFYIFKRNNMPKIIKIIFVVLLFVIPLLSTVVTVLGAFDTFINLRR